MIAALRPAARRLCYFACGFVLFMFLIACAAVAFVGFMMIVGSFFFETSRPTAMDFLQHAGLFAGGSLLICTTAVVVITTLNWVGRKI